MERVEERQVPGTQLPTAQAQAGDMIEVGLQFRQGFQQSVQSGNVVQTQRLRPHYPESLDALRPGALPALPERFVDVVSRMPFRHARRGKTSGLRRRIHPALQGAVQLVELGLQHGQPRMHRPFALTETRQQCLHFLRGKIRIQCMSPLSQPHALRCLSGIATHAATQAHDARVVSRPGDRVVPQNQLKPGSIQRLRPDRLLKA
ncbi:hypothetical protein D9M72_551390 [compost metagenome]